MHDSLQRTLELKDQLEQDVAALQADEKKRKNQATITTNNTVEPHNDYVIPTEKDIEHE
jgi:hypothetical protein